MNNTDRYTFKSGEVVEDITERRRAAARPSAGYPADRRRSQFSSPQDGRMVRPVSAQAPRSYSRPQTASRRRKKKSNSGLKAVIALLIIAILGASAFLVSQKLMLPKPNAAAVNTAAGIKLSWDEVEGAENYEIYKSVNDEWKQIKTTPKLAYTDKSAKNGEACSYRLRAVAEKKNGLYSKLSQHRIAPVSITETKVEESSVTISWSTFDTAKHYELFKRSGEGELSKLETFGPDVSSYTDTDIEINAVYCYAVRQITAHGESPLPEETSVATMSTKLDSASVKNSPSGVVVSWKGNSDFAVGFNIYRKVEGAEKWTLAGTAEKDATSFIDKGAAYGKTAKYKVTIKLNEKAEGEAKGAGSVYGVDPSKKLVALTYDDGPYSPVTNVILDTMEKHGAHCTFFVVGNRVETYNSCVTRAASLGCEVASHTYEHKYFNQLSASEVRYQVDAATKVINKYYNPGCKLLRPPGGKIVGGIGFPLILWSVDTQDWSNRNAETTLSRAKSGIFDGSIVLMHDLYPSSGQATTQLVPYLIENGYQLVTVSELFEARGVDPVNDQAYYQVRKAD